jgi:hypothetical protein
MSDSFEEMADSFEVGGFLVCFPVWLIGDSNTHDINRLLKATGEDEKESPIMFTDMDGAQACVDASPSPDEYALMPVEDPITLLGLLVLLKHKGFTDVVFDPTVTEAGFKGAIIPVASIVDTLLERF